MKNEVEKQSHSIMEPCTVQEMEGHRDSEKNSVMTTTFVVMMAVVAIGITVYPLLHAGLYMSTDAPFHLARIESLYLALKEGVFPVKVHFAEAYSYGYGVGFFYPDCFLYFPACLMLIGFSLEISYKVYAVAVTAATWGSMFTALELLQGIKCQWVHACGAAMYVMSIQYVGYLYGSQSVGSYTAMAFMPICIAELLNILYRKYRKKDLILFTIGVSCVLLSHVSTAILLLVFLFFIVLLSAVRLVKCLSILRDLFLCAVGGIFLTIGFWLPALEQIVDQKYRFQLAQYNPISEEAVSWSEIIPILGIGMVVIVLFLVIYLLRTVRTERNYKVNLIRTGAAVSVFFIVLTFCTPFWKIFGHYCEFIQFPSRLLGPATAGAVLSFCVLIGELQGRGRKAGCIVLTMTLIIIGIEAMVQYNGYGETFSLETGLLTDRIAGLGAGEEWLPEGANRDALTEPEKSYDPTKGGADGTKYRNGKYYEVYVPMKWEYYDVPYLYYKGYEAYLLDENGNPTEQLKTGKADGGGFVRVYLPNGDGSVGHVMVIYRKTFLQKLAYLVNIVFLGGCVSVGAMQQRWHRRRPDCR